MKLVEIDPKDLVVDHNVRSKPGDISGLVTSVQTHGILVPLLVAEEDGKYHVIAGSRRTAAALKAKLSSVPCVVTDNGDPRGVLEKQLIENLQRTDLSAVDEAKGFEQLVAFGLTEDEIAQVSGRDVDHVKTSLAVAGSKTAATVAAKYDLTLDQAAAIAEFDDDKEAVKALTVVAQQRPNEFLHAVAELRDNRERSVKVAALRAELDADGIVVVTEPPTWQIDRPPTRLQELTDAKGKELSPASHKTCPGRVAYVVDRKWNKPEIIHGCADPKGNGHRSRNAGEPDGSETPADREAKLEERRAMLAGNREWRAAEPIRIEFIAGLLKRKTVPAGVLRFVAEEIMGDPRGLGGRNGTTNEGLLEFFVGAATGKSPVSWSSGRVAGLSAVRREKNDPRLALVLLAQLAADREEMMDQTTWRLGSARSARWLTFLGQQGYGLSPIEKKAAARK